MQRNARASRTVMTTSPGSSSAVSLPASGKTTVAPGAMPRRSTAWNVCAADAERAYTPARQRLVIAAPMSAA